MSKPRPIASGILKLRELEVPIKLFAAARPQSLSFNLLHAKDRSRIQQKIYCPVDDAIIDRSELVRGYQVEKGVYVTFSDTELENLEDELIEITAFVDRGAVDPVYFDASYHVGCELTSVDAYTTLLGAMRQSELAAIAALTLNGKEHLALIRPKRGHLMLHTLFFASEVNSADEIDEAGRGRATEEEIHLAKRVMDEMRASFEPAKYSDRYRERVIEAAKAKLEGGDVAHGKKAAARAGRVDLAAQLRASISTHKNARPKRPGSMRKSAASRKRSETAAALK